MRQLFVSAFLSLSLAFVALIVLGSDARAEAATALYVSPQGDDGWSGTLAEPNREGTDGPFATIAHARDRVREMKRTKGLDGPVAVLLRGGLYTIAGPVTFTPEDSGASGAVVTYRAYPGEHPVISGGRAITGWVQEGELWRTEIPALTTGAWRFDALWVNGERAVPARIPNEGRFKSDGYVRTDEEDEDSTDRGKLRYREGDLAPFENLSDVRIKLATCWEAPIHYIEDWDKENRIITFTHPAAHVYGKHTAEAPYVVENVREGLDQPGEWYVNRSEGMVYYWPRKGEDLAHTEIVAPVAQSLIQFAGDPAAGAFVEHLAFDGLSFLYAEDTLPETGYQSAQAATTIGAALEGIGVRYCRIENCEIAHTGTHAIWFREACQYNRILNNDLHDLGGGGIYLGGMGNSVPDGRTTSWNEIDNNWLHGGGRVFASACGIWIGAASYNTVSHNEVFDFYYTGVSVGWSWGYGPSAAHHNIIEYNHIHRIGQRMLSDMGGIYTLGISPGTILRGNVIHDIDSSYYGSQGIYTDEGSTDIRIENNVVYDASDGAFHQHYGKDNVVVNNIFVSTLSPTIVRSREEDVHSFYFERNIVLCGNGRALGGNWGNSLFKREDNCYWSTDGEEINLAGLSLDQWRSKGQDKRSLIADPQFVDVDARDFRLRKNSPVFDLGFKPIDISRVGLYGDPARVKAARKLVAATPPIVRTDPNEEVFADLWPEYELVLDVPSVALFKTDPDRVGEKEGWFRQDIDTGDWRKIRTGQTWEEQIGYNYDGIAWYRFDVDLPASVARKKLLISLGAADERAVVYVNGQRAGDFGILTQTWNTRFEIDMTPYAKAGARNLVAVSVEDGLGAGGLWRPIKIITPRQ